MRFSLPNHITSIIRKFPFKVVTRGNHFFNFTTRVKSVTWVIFFNLGINLWFYFILSVSLLKINVDKTEISFLTTTSKSHLIKLRAIFSDFNCTDKVNYFKLIKQLYNQLSIIVNEIIISEASNFNYNSVSNISRKEIHKSKVK